MIKYEGVEKRYLYSVQEIDDILKFIKDSDFYAKQNCTQEKVSLFVNKVNDFVANIQDHEVKTTLERRETEEEARDYFGEDFIKQFDSLLTELDKQKTMVAIHGTSIECCPSICESGLKYKTPSLPATAVQQSMEYCEMDMHYPKYEGLLNWAHKNYKGLVVLAIPYECFYKEGLWNHFQETNTSSYGGQDYCIDPDFVVGYLDIEAKKIVLNPKYSRQHNYEGYEKDIDIFRENPNMDNERLTQILIDSKREPDVTTYSNSTTYSEDIDYDAGYSNEDIIDYALEEIISCFNAIKHGEGNIDAIRYESFLRELFRQMNRIKKVIPKLKTEEQVKKEIDERLSKVSSYSDDDDDIIISSDPNEWGDPSHDEEDILWR